MCYYQINTYIHLRVIDSKIMLCVGLFKLSQNYSNDAVNMIFNYYPTLWSLSLGVPLGRYINKITVIIIITVFFYDIITINWVIFATVYMGFDVIY